ncbi:unnamed protein product [Callosobruchus maculatus]|uniref:Apical junction molecule ajm1 alpha/beta domain-containing protein n=1 Tax=Callosobruchus maculatus TaxID=64391 RepID=A0A653CLN3_CALMS|nr:unnamed protein product [Callosobruchus maculatus]
MCKCYSLESKLILYVCVCVISETPAAGAVKWERQLVSRCAKMRLSKEEQSYESLETLILTSSPLMGDTFTVRELRTRCVDNLQGHLRIKGVSLKKQHPEIHRQLTAYVEDATVQLPTMTVFPKDSFTGKSFMCVIMLEGPQLYSELVKMCKCYNPESKLILYVCVCVISETPAAGAVKWERQLVSRFAKMGLSKEEQSYESLETLILPTVRELRTRCVDNLQGHLRIKGVSLKKQHPEIHRQLTAYVEDATVQLPTMTVFPKDSFTGKSFMCVIMLEVNQKSVKEVEGTRGSVRTIDVMRDVFGSV